MSSASQSSRKKSQKSHYTAGTGLDLFRRRQKLIMWAIAVPVILSFALFWNVDRFGGRGGGGDRPVGVVDGKRCYASEIQSLAKRISNGAGAPVWLVLNAQPSRNPGSFMGYEAQYADWNLSWLTTEALLRKARAAGVEVSDREVGTWLRREHPRLAVDAKAVDEAEFRKRLRRLCEAENISEPDLVAGARDWLLLRRYLQLDAALKVESRPTAFSLFAANKTLHVFSRYAFDAAASLADARAAWDAFAPEKRREEVERLMKAHPNEAAFRRPSQWKLSYLLIPFAAAPATESTEATLRDAHRIDPELKDRDFDAVRAQLAEKLARQARCEWAASALRDTVSPRLRELSLAAEEAAKPASDAAASAAVAPPPLASLASRPDFSALGVIAGDTGEKPLDADALLALPVWGGESTSLKYILGAVDSEAAEKRTDLIDRLLHRDYIVYPGRLLFGGGASAEALQAADGFLPPLEGPDGYLVAQVTAYEPWAPKALADAQGVADEGMMDKGRDLWLDEEALARARQKANDAVAGLRADPPVEPAVEPKPEVILYTDLGRRASLLDLGWGEVSTPAPVRENGRETGYEIHRLDEKRMPSTEDFAKLPDAERQRFQANAFTTAGGGVRYNFERGAFDIHMGGTIMRWFVDELEKQRIAAWREADSAAPDDGGEPGAPAPPASV